jgi:predicted nucleotide-binding protein
MDFQSGGTILEEVAQAVEDCRCGIFLFTESDRLDTDKADKAAPRDNVVFEAGFFMRAKGKERTLIIREAGAKMPTDLGGVIYAHLQDRNDISTIETRLRKFLEDRL